MRISYHLSLSYRSGCGSMGPPFSFASPAPSNELSNPSRCSRIPSNLPSTPSAIPSAASSRRSSSSMSSAPNSSIFSPSTASGSPVPLPFVVVVVGFLVVAIKDASAEISFPRKEVWFCRFEVCLSEDIVDWRREDDERRSDREKSQVPLLVLVRHAHITPPTLPPLPTGLWLGLSDRREKMEIAKAELQRALRPIRGSRVEKPDLDALVQKTLGGTKAKTDGASVPNTTWEYLLRSEILSLAVRLVEFFSVFDYQGLT